MGEWFFRIIVTRKKIQYYSLYLIQTIEIQVFKTTFRIYQIQRLNSQF